MLIQLGMKPNSCFVRCTCLTEQQMNRKTTSKFGNLGISNQRVNRPSHFHQFHHQTHETSSQNQKLQRALILVFLCPLAGRRITQEPNKNRRCFIAKRGDTFQYMASGSRVGRAEIVKGGVLPCTSYSKALGSKVASKFTGALTNSANAPWSRNKGTKQGRRDFRRGMCRNWSNTSAK